MLPQEYTQTRLEFLAHLARATGGRVGHGPVATHPLGQQLGLSERELMQIVFDLDYLGWARLYSAGEHIALTYQGLDELRKAEQEPAHGILPSLAPGSSATGA